MGPADHGRVWALDAAVVSVGETRRFTMRPLAAAGEPTVQNNEKTSNEEMQQ